MAAREHSLTSRQSRSNLWQPGPGESININVGDAERWVSGLGGGALALYGLTRGSVGGVALALLGGALVYRGVTGHCDIYQTLGTNTSTQGKGRMASVAHNQGIKVEKS